MKNFPKVKTYLVDISSDRREIEKIFYQNEIDYVVHCAAMKHVNLCQHNPSRCIKTNIFGPLFISELCLKYGVKNLLAVSTDKSKNPICTYGYSKRLMELALLEQGHSIYRGVNFFGSTGSVINIWLDQMKSGKHLSVNSNNTVRYFIDCKEVVAEILDNIDRKGVVLPKKSYKVSLHDLCSAFCKFYMYDNVRYFKPTGYEKLEEEIDQEIEIVSLGVDEIIDTFLRRL